MIGVCKVLDIFFLLINLSFFIGSFPKCMLEGQLHIIVPALIQCAQVTEQTQKWADCRRDAAIALTSVCQTVGIEGKGSGE